jgi:hypothetical protein
MDTDRLVEIDMHNVLVPTGLMLARAGKVSMRGRSRWPACGKLVRT